MRQVEVVNMVGIIIFTMAVLRLFDSLLLLLAVPSLMLPAVSFLHPSILGRESNSVPTIIRYSLSAGIRRQSPYYPSQRALLLYHRSFCSSIPTRLKASVSGIVYTCDDTADDNSIPVVVKLFTKEGCTLCDKVKDVLSSVRENHPHTLLAVDITDAEHNEWWQKYKYDIPVLHLNGCYWTKHRLTPEQAVEGLTAVKQGTFASPIGEPNATAQERSSNKQ
jgi:thiol-disulfide isomerase/thioredoxin